MRNYRNSVEIYSYSDINSSELGNSMIIRDFLGDEIICTKEMIKNLRFDYEKCLYIIECLIPIEKAGELSLLEWQRNSGVNVTREIEIKHYRAGEVVREVTFTGRCLYYT